MNISVCMMVKIASDNDVQMMRTAVNSVAFLADELCIVDTHPAGRLAEALYPVSDDGEVMMGQASLGPKTRIQQSPWRADFAYHRNESIDMATGDWVLILDHDEMVNCGNPNELKRYLGGIDVDRVQVLVNNLDATGRLMHPFNQIRLVRRGTARYEGKAHHQLMPIGAGLHYTGLSIDHYGYGLSPEAMKAKQKRTLDILLAWQKEEPDDYNIDFWLAKSYSAMRDDAKAIDCAESYLRRTLDLETSKMHKSAFWVAANHLMMIGRQEEALRWVKEGLERMPDNQDLLFMRSEIAAAKQEWDDCLDYSSQYIQRYFALNGKPDPKDPHDCYTLRAECISMCLQRVAHISLYRGLNALGLALGFLRELPDGKAHELVGDAKAMIQQLLTDVKSMLELIQKEDKETPDLWIPTTQSMS